MPKQVTINPAEMRAKSSVKFTPIPVNQYDRTVSDELAAGNLSKDDLLRIQRDMMLIRTFENMLDSVKKQGHYRDIKYDHRGPAHLSMGQEAAAVGQAFLLGIDDHIYGSHRSHGEILAKGLSAIQKLDDQSLMNIMRGYFDGDCLRVVEKDAAGDVKSLAIDYLVYGALAEIFAREAGFNKGLGGSMHAFFPPFGIYPNNAIVGGSADISVGAALYKHVNKKPGIVIGNIGDASAGCGPTWEALCFATMDQFKELWEESHRGGLPFIMNFVEQFLRHGRPARRGNDGLQGAGAPRRRADARSDARRTGRRIQPAGGRRRHSPQEGNHRPRRGPGAAGHRDLSFRRSFAVGRQFVPRQGGGRSLAEARSAQDVRRKPD